MIPSSVENVREKGLEEVPYSNEQSTHTIGDDGFGFVAQAKKIDCYVFWLATTPLLILILIQY